MTSSSDGNIPEDVVGLVDEEVGIITFVTGRINGENFWAFVSIAPSKYQDFLEAEARGGYDLTEYGDILMHGKGKTPTQSERDQMFEKYGADIDLENRIGELIDKADQS